MSKRILPRFVVKDGKVIYSSAISDEDWVKIKRLLDSGDVTKTQVAARFGVTYGAIWNRLRAEKTESRKAARQ